MELAFLIFGIVLIDLPLIVLAYMNAHWSVATICALSLINYRGEQLLRIQTKQKHLKVKEIINSLDK